MKVEVIAGNLNNLKAPEPTPDSWAANPDNEVAVWTIKLEIGMEWVLPGSNSDVNRTLYYYKGNSLFIDQELIPPKQSIGLKSKQSHVLKAGDSDCYLLLLQGRPIREPVVQYGPFVMNTQEEIQEAFEEYRKTKFGGWPWPNRNQVHDRDKGRFALHADGTEETG